MLRGRPDGSVSLTVLPGRPDGWFEVWGVDADDDLDAEERAHFDL